MATSEFISRLLQLIQAATASGAVSAAGPQHMRQLLSLAVSCFKLAEDMAQHERGGMTAAGLTIAEQAMAAAAAMAHRSSAGAWQQAGTAAAQCGMGSIADAGSSSSRQGCATGAQGVAHEAVLLVARAMHLAGRTLGDVLVKEEGDEAVTAPVPKTDKGQLDSLATLQPCSAADAAAPAAASAAAAEGDSGDRAQVAATIGALSRSSTPAMQWLAEVLPAVELPGGPGSEQACAAARQQLLQLQGGLQQDLQEAVGTMDSSRAYGTPEASSGASAQAAAASVREQPVAAALEVPRVPKLMKEFGGALCAQFPLPHCCNNPGCVELRGASELQLVGGKGCVCGRCRWASCAFFCQGQQCVFVPGNAKPVNSLQMNCTSKAAQFNRQGLHHSSRSNVGNAELAAPNAIMHNAIAHGTCLAVLSVVSALAGLHATAAGSASCSTSRPTSQSARGSQGSSRVWWQSHRATVPVRYTL
jgi:hypothetical protein